MAHKKSSYGGDEELARLLAKAGSGRSVGEIRELVRGVAAAPQGFDAEAWMRLVEDEPGPALRAQLAALKAELSTADDGIGQKGAAAERTALLRAELARRGLDGFIVPLADEHQGEYVARRAQRLAWLTGFTGSAGIAVVLKDKAAFFTDGRYTLQAEAQVDGSLYSRHNVAEEPAAKWLAKNLVSGAKLGFDPWLHTLQDRERLESVCADAGATLVVCDTNPVDAVWSDQPPPPIAPVAPHDLRFAGRASDEKRRDLAAILKEAKVDAAVLSAPDSIAWLLNVRGGDVPNTPLPLSFAILHANAHAELFIDPLKLAPGLTTHLGNEVSLAPPEALGPTLDHLGEAGKAVLIDPGAAPVWLFDRLEKAGGRVVKRPDPCTGPKARKNDIELAGIRAAHVRDGVALVRFLAWLEREARGGALTEIAAAEQLGRLRADGEHYNGPSFDTISGAGPNGAIVHYRVGPETNRTLEPGSLYLVDSGGQYLDGTTDVTRTVAIGKPSAEPRDRFTRVLKGHIALAAIPFPRGTSGTQLDAFARQFLWRAGLDYDHGTGHGVGSYLAVHEGPHRIAKRPSAAALEPGMIVSNEPGYYKAGGYGIRIENLVAVVEAPAIAGGERPMLAFETLTLAPIDRALIDLDLMTDEERAWLDAYHARVRETLTPLLGDWPDVADWLKRATAPL